MIYLFGSERVKLFLSFQSHSEHSPNMATKRMTNDDLQIISWFFPKPDEEFNQLSFREKLRRRHEERIEGKRKGHAHVSNQTLHQASYASTILKDILCLFL